MKKTCRVWAVLEVFCPRVYCNLVQKKQHKDNLKNTKGISFATYLKTDDQTLGSLALGFRHGDPHTSSCLNEKKILKTPVTPHSGFCFGAV